MSARARYGKTRQMDKDLPAVPLETIIQIVRTVVSSCPGALTLYGIIRAKQTDLFRKLTIRRLRHDLQVARDEGDREQVKRLELHIQIREFYLSDPTSQGTAIAKSPHGEMRKPLKYSANNF